MKTVLGLVVALLGVFYLTVPASAQQKLLIGGPVHVKGGPAGGSVVCRAFSWSGQVVPLSAKEIFANNSTTPLPKLVDSCAANGIAHGQMCEYSARIQGNLAYTCVFFVGPNTGAQNWAASIEIQDAQGNVLVQEPASLLF
ncbi:hypothetical protein ACMDCR_24580 [Labrys okinawensis]|uniref:hypothetical protein n=1 Tax=Labrys okinawensis TaxID=346911 RepID=UPI0039BD4B52